MGEENRCRCRLDRWQGFKKSDHRIARSLRTNVVTSVELRGDAVAHVPMGCLCDSLAQPPLRLKAKQCFRLCRIETTTGLPIGSGFIPNQFTAILNFGRD